MFDRRFAGNVFGTVDKQVETFARSWQFTQVSFLSQVSCGIFYLR